MKFGSDTLDEEQEKAEFFHVKTALCHSYRHFELSIEFRTE